MPDKHLVDPIPTVEQALLNLSVEGDSNGLLSPPPSSTSFTSLASGSTMSVSQSLPVMSDGEKSLEYRKWDERGREWLYGFVCFEQRKDRGIARGYMQVRQNFTLELIAEITGHPHTSTLPIPFLLRSESPRAGLLRTWLFSTGSGLSFHLKLARSATGNDAGTAYTIRLDHCQAPGRGDAADRKRCTNTWA